MDSRIPDEPSPLVIEQAIQEYCRLTHGTVIVEQVNVVCVHLLLPNLLSWHFDVEGQAIFVWEPCELLPRKVVAQEVAA